MRRRDMTLAERRAAFVYEACRLEAMASERIVIPEPYYERDKAFQDQFEKTVTRLCAAETPPTTPEEEHNSWWRAYEEMGWRYGPVRDPVAKTHPDMVPFNELPEAERVKDEIFMAICALARRYIKEDELADVAEGAMEASDEWASHADRDSTPSSGPGANVPSPVVGGPGSNRE